MSTLEILAFPTGFKGRGYNELTLEMLRNISATYWSRQPVLLRISHRRAASLARLNPVAKGPPVR